MQKFTIEGSAKGDDEGKGAHTPPPSSSPPDVDEAAEAVVDVPAARGDVICHHERVVHASYPNTSSAWRHAYILNLRWGCCLPRCMAGGLTGNGARRGPVCGAAPRAPRPPPCMGRP